MRSTHEIGLVFLSMNVAMGKKIVPMAQMRPFVVAFVAFSILEIKLTVKPFNDSIIT